MVRGQLALILTLSLALSGCSYTPISEPTAPQSSAASTPPVENPSPSPEPTPTASPEVTTTPSTTEAKEQSARNDFEFLLAELRIEPEFSSGYDRDLFRHWIDADSDGCNTRREVLIQESLRPVSLSANCQVSGEWLSIYDLVTTQDAGTFDVDHMVPLKEAWDSGAHEWDSSTRTAFANDLGYQHSLVAVTASSNRSKSDRDPAQWLPPNSALHCEYGFRWLAVKYRWSLAIDSAEALALGRLAANCGEQSYGELPPKRTITKSSPPTPNSTQPNSHGALDPRFGSCREALANGYGNYIKGVDLEYDWYRDGDSDGVVCE